LIPSGVDAVHHLAFWARTWILALVDLSLSSSNVDLVWLLLLELLLINYALDKCWLVIQINAMFILQIVYIIVQKLFVVTQFLSDW
jgi:hypothetical protein